MVWASPGGTGMEGQSGSWPEIMEGGRTGVQAAAKVTDTRKSFLAVLSVLAGV